MSSFTCDDKHTLIAFLYDEVDTATRDRVDAHLKSCAQCTAEVRALGDVRLELSQWAPPDAELGFSIVRKSDQHTAHVLRPAQWWRTVPAWAQAAAAILVLAAGASIANIQVRSNADGFVVTTGWMTPQSQIAPAAAPALSEPFDGAAIERRVEGLEQQLRNEIQSSRQAEPVRAAAPTADDATVRRVQQLIAASEQRHQRELAYRLAQFAVEMDAVRRADYQRIRSGFVGVDEQMFRQQQMLNNKINNVIRISGTPQQ